MKIQNSIVAVTGGAGFLGSYLCEKLVSVDAEKIIIIDDFSLGTLNNIGEILSLDNIIVETADVSNYEDIQKIFEVEQPDVVFNLAVVPLPASLVHPKEAVDKNIQITTTMCDLLRRDEYKTLIHISSSEAYGSAMYVDRRMDENHPTSPTTPYAASKLACDHIVLSYYRTFGIDVSIARPFNMYGPRQNRKVYAGVIPITVDKILQGYPPVIHGDGFQTRDYSYVQDVANILPMFYENKTTRGRIINIASGEEITIDKIIRMIIRIMDYSGPVIHTEQRPGDIRRHCGDITLAKKLLNYHPITPFEEGLKKTVRWFL